jgi:Transposase DDE domain
VRRRVFAAFQADRVSDAPTIAASAAALYAKDGRSDPRSTAAVVRESAARRHAVLTAVGVQGPFGWEGSRVTILDGTDLGGTEPRLKPLRQVEVAGLPGRDVAAYDLAGGLVVDAVAGADASTSERELVRTILGTAAVNTLFVADRHFCTTEILFRVMDRDAFFVIRQHVSLRWHPLTEAEAVGGVETGEMGEPAIEVEDTDSGERRRMRRIILKLDTPPEGGEAEVVLLRWRGTPGRWTCWSPSRSGERGEPSPPKSSGDGAETWRRGCGPGDCTSTPEGRRSRSRHARPAKIVTIIRRIVFSIKKIVNVERDGCHAAGRPERARPA